MSKETKDDRQAFLQDAKDKYEHAVNRLHFAHKLAEMSDSEYQQYKLEQAKQKLMF